MAETKVLKMESYKKGIAFSSILNLIAKLLLFFQNMVIAYYFGTNQQVDVFFYCFSVIQLMSTTLTMLNGNVLVPEAMRIRERDGQKEEMKFVNKFLYFYIIVGLFFTLVVIFLPVDTFMVLSKFDRTILNENINVVLYSVPLLTLMLVDSMLLSILSSYKFFTVPQIVKILNSAFALSFLFFFHNVLAVTSVFIGLIFGYVINLIIMIWLLRKHFNWNFLPMKYKIGSRIISNGIFSQVGTFSRAFCTFYGSYLLSGLNAGVVSALNYGRRTSYMINEMITLQFTPVAGVKINELFAVNQKEKISDVFNKSTAFLNYLLIPISAILVLYKNEIITILYARGEFSPESVLLTANFMVFFGVDLALLSINTMVSLIFMAGCVIKPYTTYQIIKNLSLVILIYFGVKYLGGIGYPLAQLINDAINLIVMYFLLKAYFPFVDYLDNMKKFFKNIFVNSIIAFGVFFLTKYLHLESTLFRLALGITVYFIIFLVLTRVMNLNKDANELYDKTLSIVKARILNKVV